MSLKLDLWCIFLPVVTSVIKNRVRSPLYTTVRTIPHTSVQLLWSPVNKIDNLNRDFLSMLRLSFELEFGTHLQTALVI